MHNARIPDLFLCIQQARHVGSLMLLDVEHVLLCIAKICGAHVYIKIVMIQRQTLSSGNVLQSINAHITVLNPIMAANGDCSVN